MYVIIFILWTIFWSLWSVLMSRLEEKSDRKTIKSILFWFSKCPKCKTRLKAKNLIPIISFFIQNKKCAFCQKPISRQYPILEITSGLIFMFSYYLVFNIWAFIIPESLHIIIYIFLAITNWLLLLIMVQDIKNQELHMPIRIISTLWILIRQFFWILGNYQAAFLSSLLFASIFLLIYIWAKVYLKRRYNSQQEWFWQWDIFLWFSLWAAIPIIEQFNALVFSWQNHVKIITSIIFIWSILSIIYAIISILINKSIKISVSNKEKTIVPFFPALIIVFWAMLIYWDKIISYLF